MRETSQVLRNIYSADEYSVPLLFKRTLNRLANLPTELFMWRSLESKKAMDILKPEQVVGFIHAAKKRNHLVCL
jgi:hypothetical protein